MFLLFRVLSVKEGRKPGGVRSRGWDRVECQLLFKEERVKKWRDSQLKEGK